MNKVALDPAYRRVTVEEFLAMDLGEAKAELEDGLIYMMAGGSETHARVAANIIGFLLPPATRQRVPSLRFRLRDAHR